MRQIFIYMISKFDKDIFEKCKTNCLSRPDLIKDALVYLHTLPENLQCKECSNALKLNMDHSKSYTVRCWCEICKKRYDSRKYTSFAVSHLQFAEILLIIFVFVDNNSPTNIISLTKLSNIAVQKIINLIIIII